MRHIKLTQIQPHVELLCQECSTATTHPQSLIACLVDAPTHIAFVSAVVAVVALLDCIIRRYVLSIVNLTSCFHVLSRNLRTVVGRVDL